jgi:phosphatidylinositol-3-phosphatase
MRSPAIRVPLLALVIAAAGVMPSPLAPAMAAASVPSFDHIFLVVMENHGYRAIVGSPHAPYINGLIASYGLATRFSAVAHPSEPNELALFGGSTFGVRDDGTYNLSRRNLVDQLSAHGRSWHVYAQDYPGHCAMVSSAHGPVDLIGSSGTYARKHEPAISFRDISGNPARCANITRLAPLDPAAADFELVVPNLTNDMHDGTIRQGDRFLSQLVPLITGSPAFSNSLLLITWDEGTRGPGGGRVATLVISPLVAPGTRSATHHDHYSLLRTIESSWALGCLHKTCSANSLAEFFAS